jgi:hypothetical protein
MVASEGYIDRFEVGNPGGVAISNRSDRSDRAAVCYPLSGCMVRRE